MNDLPEQLRAIAERFEQADELRYQAHRDLIALTFAIEQPASLPAEDGAAEDPSPVAAAPEPLTGEELGHGPWFTAEGVEFCSGCRQRRSTLELIQSQASHELHAAIDAPDSPPAAGEAEDGNSETSTGTLDPAVGPSSPPPTDPSVCPGCGQEFATPGRVGQHKRFCKGRPIAAAVPEAANGKDPREIHEDCPKCGRPFTWAPSLANHVATCRGVMAGSNRGGA